MRGATLEKQQREVSHGKNKGKKRNLMIIQKRDKLKAEKCLK